MIDEKSARELVVELRKEADWCVNQVGSTDLINGDMCRGAAFGYLSAANMVEKALGEAMMLHMARAAE